MTRQRRGRLEGWQIAPPLPLAILRDAVLRTAPQDEVRQFGFVSFCGGIVMVISRCFGCTKLASANIAP